MKQFFLPSLPLSRWSRNGQFNHMGAVFRKFPADWTGFGFLCGKCPRRSAHSLSLAGWFACFLDCYWIYWKMKLLNFITVNYSFITYICHMYDFRRQYKIPCKEVCQESSHGTFNGSERELSTCHYIRKRQNELTWNPANSFCLRKMIYMKLSNIGFLFKPSIIKSIILMKCVGLTLLNTDVCIITPCFTGHCQNPFFFFKCFYFIQPLAVSKLQANSLILSLWWTACCVLNFGT